MSEVDVAAAKREEKAGAAEIGLGAVLTGGITAGLGGVTALGMGKLGTVGAERSIKLQQQAKESLLKKNAEKVKATEGATSKEVGDVIDPIKEIQADKAILEGREIRICLLYTSPSPRDGLLSRMPSSA